jgi:hypothetical protein
MVASGVEDERVRREVGEEEEHEVFLVPCVHYNFHGKVRPEDDVVILQSECPPSPFTAMSCLFVTESMSRCAEDDVLLLQLEWPPPLFEGRVFSSRTGQWEERTFVRDGQAAGTVANLRLDEQIHLYLGRAHSTSSVEKVLSQGNSAILIRYSLCSLLVCRF